METLELICDTFGPQAAAKKIRISFEVCQTLRSPNEMNDSDSSSEQPIQQSRKTKKLPWLIGDQRRFRQVLMNLVKNSLKFTIEGCVTIKAYYRPEPENLLIVHVVDTGVGIAEEDFPKLFTRFGKLQRTSHMNSEGIGLGLNMVKQIVESGGG